MCHSQDIIIQMFHRAVKHQFENFPEQFPKNIERYSKKRAPPQRSPCLTGNFLSSQSVSRQVLSASECLTTVFGMGTGGTIQASSPDILFECLHIQNYTEEITLSNISVL